MCAGVRLSIGQFHATYTYLFAPVPPTIELMRDSAIEPPIVPPEELQRGKGGFGLVQSQSASERAED
jgi:hypothetical protein